jgi:anti-sigma B factor antagonist
MKLNVEIQGDTAVVTLEGALDAQTAPTLKNSFAEIIRDGRQDIVLDLTAVDFMDSSGLGAVVGAYKQVRIGKGDLRIAGLQPVVRKVFELTRLDRVFRIFDSTDQAVAATHAA